MTTINSVLIQKTSMGIISSGCGWSDFAPLSAFAPGMKVSNVTDLGDKWSVEYVEKYDAYMSAIYETERLRYGSSGASAESFTLVFPKSDIHPFEGSFYRNYSIDFLHRWMRGRNNLERMAFFRHEFTDYELACLNEPERRDEIRSSYNREIAKAYPALRI
jgi:hypothetical protein